MKKRKIDLSVIILNYNTKNLLRGCLLSLEKSKKRNFSFEIFVVDNASSDGSVEMVEEKFSDVKIIRNRKNLGFAAGNNIVLWHAHGDYSLLLNPDTIVQPETLQVMFDFMEANPKTGAATCRVELPDGRLDSACHRGFPSPWNSFAYFSGLTKIFRKSRLFSGYLLSHLDLNRVHEIDSGCGAFLFVRRKAGEEVEWLDEEYFWYGEDLDFCYRVKQKGWKVMYVPKTKIIHYKGASSGVKKQSRQMTTVSRSTKIRAVRSSTEVMRIFFQKHYQNRYPKSIYWLVMKGIDLLEKRRLAKLSF